MEKITLAHLTRGVHVYPANNGYVVEWYEEGDEGALYVRSEIHEEEAFVSLDKSLRRALMSVVEHVGEPQDFELIGNRLFGGEDENG